MFLSEIATNHMTGTGALFMKALVGTIAAPTGAHRFGAFGRDADRHILLTECRGKPYTFSFGSDSLDIATLRDPTSHDFISFNVEEREGLSGAITMHDSMDPEESFGLIAPESMLLYELERIRPGMYGERPANGREPYRIIALGSVERDSFLILCPPWSDGYLILFVPNAFTESTEWVLAMARPWEYELVFVTGKSLCIPKIRRKDAGRK